jgi:hypothetical protein
MELEELVLVDRMERTVELREMLAGLCIEKQ